MPINLIHAAFEIHPVTLVVLLSVRTKNILSVTVTPKEQSEPGETIVGDCVILYGQSYHIVIASYEFSLVWRKDATKEALKELAIQDYRDAQDRAKQLRSRDQPDRFEGSDVNSLHMTKLHSAKENPIEEVEELRVLVGQGGFGSVFETVNCRTGFKFAVKVVDLTGSSNMESARMAIHREFNVLESIKHDNIIEYLGQADFHTNTPRIFMPLLGGNLTSLAKTSTDHDDLCSQVLQQMLEALDYLAKRRICHRDVKPGNILFQKLSEDRFHFKLADFGLATCQQLATAPCGTDYYQAPELYHTSDKFRQSPKMDVWSLFVTILVVHSRFAFPPTDAEGYDDIVQAVLACAEKTPRLQAMAIENPTHRASAAQMLTEIFRRPGQTEKEVQLSEQVPSQQQPTQERKQPPQQSLIVHPEPATRCRRSTAPVLGAARPGLGTVVREQQRWALAGRFEGIAKRKPNQR